MLFEIVLAFLAFIALGLLGRSAYNQGRNDAQAEFRKMVSEHLKNL